MALWRDPLDELIDDLEQALPSPNPSWQQQGPPLEDLQWAVTLLMYARTDEERARAHQVAEEIFQPGYTSKF